MSFQYILEDYQKMYDGIKSNTTKAMWIFTVIIYLLTLLFFFVFPKTQGFSVVVIVFLSVSAFMTLLTLLVSTVWFNSNKPFVKVFIPAAIKDISAEMELPISIETFVKEKEYIKRGGLFTRASSVITDWKITGVTNEGSKYEVFDSLVFTQADKSRIEHFKGIYYILDIPNNKFFQLRDKGKPKLKGIKFDELKSVERLRDFVAEGEYKSIDQRFYKLFEYLKTSLDLDKLYIGGIDGELHIALHKTPNTKKIKEASEENYKLIKEELRERVLLIELFYSIINN